MANEKDLQQQKQTESRSNQSVNNTSKEDAENAKTLNLFNKFLKESKGLSYSIEESMAKTSRSLAEDVESLSKKIDLEEKALSVLDKDSIEYSQINSKHEEHLAKLNSELNLREQINKKVSEAEQIQINAQVHQQSRLEDIEQEKEAIAAEMSVATKGTDKWNKLLQKRIKLTDEKNSIEKEQETSKLKSEGKTFDSNSAYGDKLNNILSITKSKGNDSSGGMLNAGFTKLSDKLGASNSKVASAIGGKLGSIAGPMGKMLTVVGNIADTVGAMRKVLNGYIDQAASFLATNYGLVNANLEGSNKSFSSIESMLQKSDTGGTLMKQTDYLANVARLTSDGIVANVEQRALLETIKSKVLNGFDATNSNLTRLVRLSQQQDITSAQFGLENLIKRALNAQFKDSSYINDLYSTITGAIQDAAVSNNAKDTTPFYGVLQSWLGAMYESGMDSGTISKIASGINNLGSGNITALNSDSEMQRLILLSMDNAGMNYADILQNGLTASDANELLSSMVSYLKDIVKNTSDNNVLKSSYSNLFSLTMSDMKAIKNMPTMSVGSNISYSDALIEVKNELQLISTNDRTLFSEKIDNALSNLKYSFGSYIAESPTKYVALKGSSAILDLIDGVSSNGKIATGSKLLNGVLKVAKTAANLTYFTTVGMSGLHMLSNLGSVNSLQQDATGTGTSGNSLYQLFQTASQQTSTGTGKSLSAGTATSSSSSGSSSSPFKSFIANSDAAGTKIMTDTTGGRWDEDEEDASLKILKEIEETIMIDEKKKAIAVSLQGMSDNVLRSFASIFADEDAMEDTFKGTNNVLKDALFDYASDKTTTASSTTLTK